MSESPAATWVIVLVKDLDSAKQRLGPVLDSKARRDAGPTKRRACHSRRSGRRSPPGRDGQRRGGGDGGAPRRRGPARAAAGGPERGREAGDRARREERRPSGRCSCRATCRWSPRRRCASCSMRAGRVAPPGGGGRAGDRAGRHQCALPEPSRRHLAALRRRLAGRLSAARPRRKASTSRPSSRRRWRSTSTSRPTWPASRPACLKRLELTRRRRPARGRSRRRPCGADRRRGSTLQPATSSWWRRRSSPRPRAAFAISRTSPRARRRFGLAPHLIAQPDPRLVQVVLDESVRVLRSERILITRDAPRIRVREQRRRPLQHSRRRMW